MILAERCGHGKQARFHPQITQITQILFERMGSASPHSKPNLRKSVVVSSEVEARADLEPPRSLG